MTQFTPGPWTTVPWTEQESEVRARVNGKPFHVCGYALNADARLIAAAPEIYEALQEAADLCVGTFAEGGSPHKRMLAALAKARGEA